MRELAKGCTYALLRLTFVLLALAIVVPGALVVVPVVWLLRRLQDSTSRVE